MAGSVTVYTDGASEGNPGRAGAGYVLLNDEGTEVERGSRPLGRTTNNVAEYQALLMGLKAARDTGATRVLVRMDSELVVRQMQGTYKVKHPDLRPLYDQAQALTRAFSQSRFEHVPRARNQLADSLASAACKLNANTGSTATLNDPELIHQGADTVADLGRIALQGRDTLMVSLHQERGRKVIRIERIGDTKRTDSRVDIPDTKLGELLDALELGWAYLHNDSDNARTDARNSSSARGKRRP